MHYGRYYCAKLAGLFLFKVTPIVRTCIISISWKIIDNDNDNNNDDDDNDENRSANTEQQKISIKIILKFAAAEGKPEFCPKPKPDQIGICAVTPAKEMTIVQVPKNAALMDTGTFA